MSKFMVGERVLKQGTVMSARTIGEVKAVRQGRNQEALVRWGSGVDQLIAEEYLVYARGTPSADALLLTCPTCKQAPHHTCLSTVWSPGLDEVPVHEHRLEAGRVQSALVKATNAALPTEPYTSIIVQWRDPDLRAATMFTLSEGGSWSSADGVATDALEIIGFEIKGEPRAVGYGRGWNEATEGMHQLLEQARSEGAQVALARVEEINRGGGTRVPEILTAVRAEFPS